MNIAKFAVKRPVTILMVVLIVLMLGGVSFSKMSVDLMPDMELPMVVVLTTYEGAGAEEVEKTVTKTLEGGFASISGLDQMQSSSSAGQSTIMLMFEYGTNLDDTMMSLRDQVAMYSGFMPDAVGDSSIIRMNMNSMPVIMLTVSGDRHIDDVRRIVDDKIAPRLERGSGIAQVAVSGGNETEIRIEVDPLKLQAYGVTVDGIVNMLRSENNNTSAGYVVEGSRDMLVRVTGEYQTVLDIRNTKITTNSGATVRLDEVATISEASKDLASYNTLDGKSVVAVAITKESDGNTVAVDRTVSKAIAELKQELDDDIQIDYAFNQADYINIAIDGVIQSAGYSALLAIIVLLIFLRNIRSTLIVGTAIPLSVIATFVLLYFDNQTLNMLTLGGLALGIGMTVDNAIVVLENIYRHRSMGKGKIGAAIEGTKEVAGPVVASTLTTVAVFAPIVFTKGMASEILTPLALTIGFTLFASLMVALTFVPMLSSKILVVNENTGRKRGAIGKSLDGLGRMFGGWFDKIDSIYATMVTWALGHRKSVLAIVFVLMIASMAFIPMIGMELIPVEDTGQINISVELPNNTILSETSAVAARIEAICEEFPEVDSIFASIGGSGGMSMSGSSSNTASFTVMLSSVTQRERSADDVAHAMQKRFDTIAGADIEVSAASMTMGSSTPISVMLLGQEMDTLEDLSKQVVDLLEGISGITLVTNSMTDANDELNVVIDRERAAFYQVNAASVYSTLGTALQGMTASTYKVDGEEFDITVIYPDERVNSLEKIKQLTIPTNSGGYVPLEEIATIDYGTGQTSITRYNQSRVATVSAEIYGRDLGSISQDVKTALAQLPIPSGYEVSFGGSSEDMVETFADLGLALVMAILLVYMILACQFEELLNPLVILFSMPPMFVGVILGLLVTGNTLNMLSIIGVIMLAGIVVNNAIVLVDYINVLRRDHGMEKTAAIIEAGRTRLRPILMTTLTTVMAMIPQMIGSSEGAELMQPLASSIIGGLSFSTVITLILVPVMYHIMDSISTKIKSIFTKNSVETEEASYE